MSCTIGSGSMEEESIIESGYFYLSTAAAAAAMHAAAMHHQLASPRRVCGMARLQCIPPPFRQAAPPKQATMATILPSFYPQRTKQKEEA